jgi:hypothetical protein
MVDIDLIIFIAVIAITFIVIALDERNDKK